MSHKPDRRHFLAATAGVCATPLLAQSETQNNSQAQQPGSESANPNLRLATFRFDITPPIGHSLCGGWIKPVIDVDDPLEAIGYVLLGAGDPIVVCVLDWTGLLNSAHLKWRQMLAEAVGTTPDRVAVQCVHQHNAPFACLDAESIVNAQGDLPHIIETDFFNRCLASGRKAVQDSLQHTSAVTHVAHGESAVEKIASNRRIIGLDGKVLSQRGSSSTKPEHHVYPEGLIDPMLKTIAFYNGDQPLVSAHYYACHPMSYYGDGRVSADFCGLARRQRQSQTPGCTQLYFNGCGGNIGAGKYNDGSKQARVELTQRLHQSMMKSEASLIKKPVKSIEWKTRKFLPPLNPAFNETALVQEISKKSNRIVARNRRAYTVAFIRRIQKQIPILLSALQINDISILHLPGECFVEYQLRAQAQASDQFVACTAYGDGGPWYIPTRQAYPQGGYAVSVAWCADETDQILSAGIQSLLDRN